MTALLVGVLVGAAVAGGVVYTKFALHGKFKANTFVAGLDVSYRDHAESKYILEKAREKFLATEIEISFKQETKKASYADLGVDILVEETLSALEKIDAGKLSPLDLIAGVSRQKENLPVITNLDNERLTAKLDELFSLSALAPQEGGLKFDEKGKLQIEDGKPGELVDRAEIISNLKNSAKWMTPTPLVIVPKKAEPTINRSQLEAQMPEIEAALDHEFSLLDPVYSDNWDTTLRENPQWVEFVPRQSMEIPFFSAPTGTGQAKIAIEINQEELDRYVDEKISKWLDRPAQDVNIFTDESGKVVIEGRGSNGLKVQRRQLKLAIELAVENRIKDVPIPVIEITPEIKISQGLQEKGIKERIAVGHTSYYGSPVNRVHNIKTGAAKFNGLIIAPDETFSFNTNLGQVDASTGYRKELVIKEEGTIPEYGGGICQVSTTVFRAMLLAGLPIIERNQHSYAVSYYSQILGHGLDATIYLGGADLRFKNDTGNHILVQTYTENDYELYIVFYGTETGRKVELEGPYLSNYRKPGATIYEESPDLPAGQTKQVEKAHTGFDALWYRHITFADGTTTTEPIETHYKAVAAKILNGPPLPSSPQ